MTKDSSSILKLVTKLSVEFTVYKYCTKSLLLSNNVSLEEINMLEALQMKLSESRKKTKK